jgi:peptidoglycan/LPS O-acetylase OafA/YrhL
VYWWTRPFRFLGYISFGLYMLHMLIFTMYDMVQERRGIGRSAVMSLQAGIVRFAIVFALSVLVCFLSRRYFEGYFLRLKSKLAPNTAYGSVRPD